MTTIHTVAEAATRLGVSPRTVRRHRERLGLGVHKGVWLLSTAEIKLLGAAIVGKVGNPNFTPGNHFGRPSK